MAYDIQLKPAAVRDLKKLEEDIQKRVADKIDSLADDPRPQGVETVKGSSDLLRIRVGDYRILYQAQNKVSTVLVIRIRHRREAYRNLP